MRQHGIIWVYQCLFNGTHDYMMLYTLVMNNPAMRLYILNYGNSISHYKCKTLGRYGILDLQQWLLMVTQNRDVMNM